MKIPKKILTMTLCSLISFGGCQLTLLKANAQEVTTSSSSNIQWKENIKLRLSEKDHPFNKYWCELELYDENGSIRLNEKEKIPYGFNFDDTFFIGVNHHENGTESEVEFRVTFDGNKPAQQQVEEQIKKFNNSGVEVGDNVYMHGLYYDDTFVLYDKNNVLTKLPQNNITKKYSSKWYRGYSLRYDGLHESIFRHTDVGVSLASKAYW